MDFARLRQLAHLYELVLDLEPGERGVAGRGRAGGQESVFDLSEMKAMNKNALRARYERTDFVESLDLDHIRPVLVGHP